MMLVDKILGRLGYKVQRENEIKPLELNFWWIKRTLYFKKMFDLVHDIEGDVVECGVGKGETFFILSAFVSAENSGRNIWGFDSFEGFPEPSKEDASPRNTKKGEWNYYSKELIFSRLQKAGIPLGFLEQRVKLVKGFFNESLTSFTGESVALLHLDVDLYQSYKDTLEYFWSKVSPGGVVLFDEYKQPGILDVFPGAAMAIDEFFGDQQKLIQFDETIKRYYIIKK
jgi:hypothetical protein